jgi:phosphoglycolate phosphatase-like HAD superfamily hydrolase
LVRETLDPARVTLLPGVRELVEQLHDEPKIQLAVLTGNLEPMAWLKLNAVGLASFFPFGAFGSDSPRRDDLPAIAVERARMHTGRLFQGKDIAIIGDTEHDIRCGAALGALAISVCTGSYTREDLLQYGPDVILDDLTDYAQFRAHLL